MAYYDYESGKQRIIDVLTSKTEVEEKDSIPASEEEFTYKNGIIAWVGALFVDIRDSTSYFKDKKPEQKARILRAFHGEVIRILKQNAKYRQIGIRGDCVYAIFSSDKQEDLQEIFDEAAMINTYQEMFQKILSNYNMPTFKVGIGLGASKTLIVKAGVKGSGINDFIWIGDAVVDASNLSSLGNKNGRAPIIMDSCFYENIKGFKANADHKNDSYCKKIGVDKMGKDIWATDMVFTTFNNWIMGGMK